MSVKVEVLGGDRYRVRVYVGNDPATGRPRQRSRSFRASTAKERKELAARAEHELRAELEESRKERGTVSQAVKEWLTHKESTAAATTRQRNVTITDRIIKDLGHHQLRHLSTRHVDAWYGQLRTENIAYDPKTSTRHRTESTIHHYHRVLRSILRQAKKWGWVTSAVTEDTTLPKRRRHRLNVPATETVLALVESATPELRFAAALAARTGLRRGELMGLCWDDVTGSSLRVERALVETKAGGLAVKTTKTDDAREVELGPETILAIAFHRQYLESEARKLLGTLVPDGPMFPNLKADRHGRKPRRPHWLTTAWADHCKTHGAHVRFHDLRHWHITTLINAGIPVSAVSARAGHALVSTTLDIYTHTDRDGDSLAAAAIDRVLSLETPALPVPT